MSSWFRSTLQAASRATAATAAKATGAAKAAVQRSVKRDSVTKGKEADAVIQQLMGMVDALSKPDPSKSMAERRRALLAAWKERLTSDDEYRDAQGDAISVKNAFLRAELVEALIQSFLLHSPDPLEEEDLLEFLDLCLFGDKEEKDALVKSVWDLGISLKSMKVQEQMVPIISAVVGQLKKSMPYEEARQSTLDEQKRTESKLGELNRLPEVSDDDATDEILRERLMRSAALLDSNSVVRKLISSLPPLIDSGKHSEVLAALLDKVKEVQDGLEEDAMRAETELQSLSQQKERAEEAKRKEEVELDSTEERANAELEQLRERESQLEQELAAVREQIQTNTSRISAILEKRTSLRLEADSQIYQFETRSKDVDAGLQAARTNLAGTQHTQDFITRASQMASKAISAAQSELTVLSRHANTEHKSFLELHLRHQSDMLVHLRKILDFCFGELEQMRSKYDNAHKLGLKNIADDLPVHKVQDQYFEAIKRVRFVKDDVAAIKEELGEESEGSDDRDSLLHALILGLEQQLQELEGVMAQCDEGSQSMMLHPSPAANSPSATQSEASPTKFVSDSDVTAAASPAAAVASPSPEKKIQEAAHQAVEAVLKLEGSTGDTAAAEPVEPSPPAEEKIKEAVAQAVNLVTSLEENSVAAVDVHKEAESADPDEKIADAAHQAVETVLKLEGGSDTKPEEAAADADAPPSEE